MLLAKQFIVDGLDEINDPRGMIGVRLEMEGTIITTVQKQFYIIHSAVLKEQDWKLLDISSAAACSRFLLRYRKMNKI